MNTSPQRPDHRAIPSLEARGERSLIRTTGCRRYLCFTIRVPEVQRRAVDRLPIHLGLVIDRSGSMQGEKLITAKRAALAVLDSLDEQDQAALVVFDDRIDTLQPLACTSKAAKAAMGEALQNIAARGSTALQAGWLTGCSQVAGEGQPSGEVTTRCFLLTDGQANLGESDPEQMAMQVGEVLARTGVVTSTFGIGDYNEQLLAPMASAGGGQFHHLRSSADIMATFLGELGDVMAVACRHVRLEVAADPAVRLEVVSDYRATDAPGGSVLSLQVGDLMSGEERPIVLRANVAPQGTAASAGVHARLLWQDAAGEQASTWQVVTLTYAGQAACDAERDRPDPVVMQWAGLHQGYRAQQEASALFSHGGRAEAHQVLQAAAASIAAMAPASPAVQAVASELLQSQDHLQDKELLYQATRRQRGHKDHRSRP